MRRLTIFVYYEWKGEVVRVPLDKKSECVQARGGCVYYVNVAITLVMHSGLGLIPTPPDYKECCSQVTPSFSYTDG